MRTTNAAIISFLQENTEHLFADTYQIDLINGTSYYYTTATNSWTLGVTVSPPITYQARQVLFSGVKLRQTDSLDIDEQELKIAYKPGATIAGQTWFQAMNTGILDGARITRGRAFFRQWGQQPVGGQVITLFYGYVASVLQAGASLATVQVKSDLNLLDMDIPRNLWGPTCIWVFGTTNPDGSGCKVNRNLYAQHGIVGSSPSFSKIPWAHTDAGNYFAQGTVQFETGANVGSRRTIQYSDSTQLVVTYPWNNPVAAGDQFVAYPGCDRKQSTCSSKYNNLPNFRGFPYVPPPETAI